MKALPQWLFLMCGRQLIWNIATFMAGSHRRVFHNTAATRLLGSKHIFD
jgi:hypothetical protein